MSFATPASAQRMYLQCIRINEGLAVVDGGPYANEQETCEDRSFGGTAQEVHRTNHHRSNLLELAWGLCNTRYS